MRYRRLGTTGLEVSEIGFGCWGIGGDTYGPTDDTVSVRTVREACARGISFFDTSDFYGQGRSESVLGEALKGIRDQAVLATKVGALATMEEQDFTGAYIVAALERSLKRLRMDHVDLYQLHNPPPDVFEKGWGTMEALRDLKAQGKIRAFGISVRKPEDAFTFIEKYGIRSVQVNFNLMDQRIKELGLLDFAARHGAGVIARTPLCFGFLSGSYGVDSFGAKDHRAGWAREQREVWAAGIGKFLTGDKPSTGETKAQFALRFCLSHEALSVAIPGMLLPEHVSENAGASGLPPFRAEELDALFQVYKSSEFFVRRKK